MKLIMLCVFILVKRSTASFSGHVCGCKVLRDCYEVMLKELTASGEAYCIEDAAMGSSTISLFLKALNKYCEFVIHSNTSQLKTFEGRYLHEVVLHMRSEEENVDKTPVILIDAGQQGGPEPVLLAMYLIEQLTACTENEQMIQKVKWVILPSVNPDGTEINSYYETKYWMKNSRSSDFISGVDITHNFDSHWERCPKVENGFSQVYPGPSPASENETKFVQDIISKYQENIKAYVSLRRNGHAILYPFGYMQDLPQKSDFLMSAAANISAKINQRAGTLNSFTSSSIFDYENRAHCGHSVDYAYGTGVPLSFEMRVGLGSHTNIMSKFHVLPASYDETLRNGYYTGIKELYNIVVRAELSKRIRH